MNFRSKVFHYAHQLVKSTGKAFSVCLSKAWALYRLTRAMRAEVVRFAYEKADGTLRKAVGTLKDTADKIKGTGTPNFKTLCYFDVEAGGFRSFKIENLIHTYNS